ncbi:calcium-binding protein [Methylorubrum suomiense]
MTNQIVELVGGGFDTVSTSISYTLDVNVEQLILAGNTAIDGTGNDDDNVILGNNGVNVISGLNGDDILRGYGGNDTLYGGAGNDILYGDIGFDALFGGEGDDRYYTDANDTITEEDGQGIDTVFATTSTLLVRNVENLTLIGSSGINGTGNELANIIIGNAAANVLDGGLGADILIGGVGNDTYIVDDAGDVVIERPGEGRDLVKASISWTLGSDLEDLTLTGTADLAGTGNGLANVITGNTGANLLTGGDGNDTLQGGAGADTLVGEAGADYLLGGEGDDLLIGGADNDRLDGGLGADRMQGGAGADTYTVNDAGDVVDETGGDGIDLVNSSVSFDLGDAARTIGAVENLTLTGTDDLAGAGNALTNVITGNVGANLLSGGGGNDYLYGMAGNDTLMGDAGADYLLGGEGDDLLIGGADNDRLDGGLGADRMQGGAGADTYTVNDAGDIVDETGGDGTDVVNSAIDFSLGDAARAIGAIENLTLTGTANLAGTGNGLANVITGNAGANVLSGGDGADSCSAVRGTMSLRAMRARIR